MSTAVSDVLFSSRSHVAVAVTRAEGYRPEIDGLRAVAIIGVVLYHAGAAWLPGGFAGVDVFFVISGYLISGIIFRALEQDAFSFSEFYARRIRRIFPALILMLITVWVISWPVLLWDEYQLLGKHIVAGGAFSVNLVLYSDFNLYFGATTTPLIHLWSLGVEEQFYILWPLFLVLLWRFRSGSVQMAVLVGLTAISFVLNVVALETDQTASFYLPTSRMWELASGGCIALIRAHHYGVGIKRDSVPNMPTWARIQRLSLHTRGWLGASLIVIAFFVLQDHWAFPGWWALVPCAGAAVLISAGPQSWVNREVLASGPLVFVGKISYPLYLWHWPLLSLGRLLSGGKPSPLQSTGLVAFAILLSWFTYTVIEKPIRHSGRQGRWILGLAAGMGLSVTVGLLTYCHVFQPRSERYQLDPFIRASREDWFTGQETSWTWYTGKPLWLGAGKHRTLFLGDSNMQQYYPRIAHLYAEHPHNSQGAVFYVMAGCAPSMDDIVRTMDNSFAGSACRSFLTKALEYARTSEVDTVVFAALWRLYLAANWDDFSRTPLRPNAQLALEDLGHTISDLVRRGKKVYVVLNIPISRKFDPRHMIHRKLTTPAFAVEVHTPTRSEMAATIGIVNEKLREVALRAGAQVIDPTESLCTFAECPAVTMSDEPMYRDHAHLKPSFVSEHIGFLDRTVLTSGPTLSGHNRVIDGVN
jgi:peptidoglycan/LPS O-acetylase OafA/YrhL